MPRHRPHLRGPGVGARDVLPAPPAEHRAARAAGPAGPPPGAGAERTPGSVGLAACLAAAKWERRAEALRAAYAAHPERFPRGAPIPPPLLTAAWINKPAARPTLEVPAKVGS